MNTLLRITVMCMVFVATTQNLRAQQSNVMSNITGNFEVNSQYYRPDSAILAPDVPEKTHRCVEGETSGRHRDRPSGMQLRGLRRV